MLASIALEFGRGTSARHATAGESWGRAFSSLVGRNRRRYGGYVVHAAIVLLAIGVVGSSAYDSKTEALLRPGRDMSIGDYTLIYAGTRYAQVPNVTEGRAAIRVTKGGDYVGTLHPGKNVYAAEQQTSREVAIRSDYLTGEDLFLNADDLRKDGSVLLEASVKPLVNLIWLAGLVFLFGSVVAMWPDAREERRLATRYAEHAGSRAGVTIALVLAALLGLAAILAVALPFLREPEVRPEEDRLAGLDPTERRRLALLEERDRALAALSELELDHRTGKVSDEDYRELVGPLRARAAAALKALEPTAAPAPERSARQHDERISPAVRAIARDVDRLTG